MVAGLQRFDAGPDIDHDARALMAEDRGKQALRIGARERERVGVADAGGLDLDQHLARLRPLEIDRLDGQRRSRPMRHRRAHFHAVLRGCRRTS